MNPSDAKRVILELLHEKGKATNRQMIRAVGGDENLFEEVREQLILEDLAEDKDGVGLIHIGVITELEPAKGAEAEERSGELSPSLIHKTAAPGKNHRIFLSYGRADAEDLASRLEKDLSEKGHSVWLDKQQIKSGVSWEEQIERAILEQEIFVSLLTPHAVRRPAGVCLDQISMARFNNLKIIPAMVIQCRPPLGIFRLDWVDFQDWRKSSRYQDALNHLLIAMEKDVEVEGTHTRIFSTLKPLDFGAEVSRLTRDFTGRQWLLDELAEWLRNEKSRVFFITGDPGTGKSAVMAYLVHKHPQVGAYHFCVSSLQDSLDPFRFIRSIASQLATQLHGYRAALDSLDLDQIAESDAGVLLRRLLADPLKGEKPEKPVLLLVDALDEALAVEGRTIAQVLCERLEDLPSWVRLVTSSRKEPEILDMFSRFDPLEIDAARIENLQDVAAYLERRFQDPELSGVLARTGANPQTTAELISKKGEGNFLYVTQAVEAIEAGQIDPRRPGTFPDGLVGIYQSFFNRVFPRREGYNQFRPLLDVMVAAREPLSAERIAEYTELDIFDVEKQLQKITAFFPERTGVYAPYHKSITDWLSGEVGRSMIYRVNVKQGHYRMAEKLLADYKAGNRDRFLLAHLPAHLINSQRWDDLETILTDLNFIDSKCATDMTYDLVKDYTAALAGLPEAQNEKQKELRHAERIRTYSQDLIARAKDEIEHLDVIPSIVPWPEAEIRKDMERIIHNPTRLDRIRAFSQFVNAGTHVLAKFGSLPGFTLQHALNFANSGPVADAAEGMVSAASTGPLLIKGRDQRPDYTPHPALLKTLEGHTGPVLSISVTPDGKLAVSGSSDTTCRVWDLESGACLQSLEGHTDSVTSVSVTPDGRLAVSGSSDTTCRVWDLESGACDQILVGHTNSVRSVSVTPNGKMAISGSSDTTCRVWDLESGKSLRTLEGHEDSVTSVIVTPDGKLGLSGSWDKTCRVWDLEKGECLQSLEGHSDLVMSVSIIPDGKLAVSAGDDGICRVWDLERWVCLQSLEGHTKSVRSVSVTPDGKLGVSGSWDKTFRVWDLEKGKCLKSFEVGPDLVLSVSITPDAKMAVSGSWGATCQMWDLKRGEVRRARTVVSHSGWVRSVITSPDGRLAISGSDDGICRVWDFEKKKCLRILEGHMAPVASVNVTSDAKLVVSGSEDKTCRLWNLESGACLQTLEGHTGWVRSVGTNPDGKLLVSGSSDKTCRVWNLESGNYIRTLKGHTGAVTSVCFSPDGKLAVSGSQDGTCRVWNLESGRCFQTLEGHTNWVTSVDVSPKGRLVLSGSDDGTCRVWDLKTGNCLRTYKGHAALVSCTSIFPDSRLAISGSKDGTCRVWDLETLKLVAIYPLNSGIRSLSAENAYLHLVCGTIFGEVVTMKALNFPTAMPVVTPVRFWLFGDRVNNGHWTDDIMTGCKWCGQRFKVPDEILDVTAGIVHDINLHSDQSPCLELPEEAWKEPRFLSECPLCHKPLRYNPFVVDNRDRY